MTDTTLLPLYPLQLVPGLCVLLTSTKCVRGRSWPEALRAVPKRTKVLNKWPTLVRFKEKKRKENYMNPWKRLDFSGLREKERLFFGAESLEDIGWTRLRVGYFDSTVPDRTPNTDLAPRMDTENTSLIGITLMVSCCQPRHSKFGASMSITELKRLWMSLLWVEKLSEFLATFILPVLSILERLKQV